jgi:catechol 2,3-dioxygenase-like lactoylglutathione lyase family enzyme
VPIKPTAANPSPTVRYRDPPASRNRTEASCDSREPAGPDARWLTVVSPEDEGGVELLVIPGSSETGSDQFQRRQYEAGKPALSFAVSDVHAVFDDLSAQGVRFTLEPTAQPYGGIDAVADDGCGNYVNFSQETA